MKDLKGMRFGKLTAIEYAYTAPKRGDVSIHRYAYWLCRCDCGNETVVRSDSLVSGNTASCGCGANHYRRRKWKES